MSNIPFAEESRMDPSHLTVGATRSRPWWQTAWATSAGLVLILLLAAYVRSMSLYSWDGSTGQHPDERFFVDVTTRIRVPTSLATYFDAAHSPANPRNVERDFYVYGTFPPMLTRLVAVMLTPNEQLPPKVEDMTRPAESRALIANPELDIPKVPAPIRHWLNPEDENLTTYSQLFNVGRSLAVLFDLGSVLLVFLTAQRLYGRRVGLLAALFSALAVMHIQQAHFYVDPAFSTFFVFLALYWAVRVAQRGGVLSFAMLGISIGAAAANRVTLGSLGLLAVVAAALSVLVWRDVPIFHLPFARSRGQQAQETPALFDLKPVRPPSFWDLFLLRSFPLLCLAGLLTLVTFRVLQPYAFVGSSGSASGPSAPEAYASDTVGEHGWLEGAGFFDIRLEPRFLENMRRVKDFVTGEIDFYPSQQWVHRPPYLFSLRNMVIWGMGPLLGVTVWMAWAVVGWGHIRLWIFGQRPPLSHDPATNVRAAKSLASLVLWVWVGFYFLWQGNQFAANMRYMLPIYGALIILGAWLLVWAGEARGRYLSGKLQRIRDRLLGARVGATSGAPERQPGGEATLPMLPMLPVVLRLLPLLLVVMGTVAWAYAFTRIYTREHSRILAARWILRHAPDGSSITYESWDDPLPLQVGEGNPWGTSFHGIRTHPYAEDEPAKFFGQNGEGISSANPDDWGLLNQLAVADYISLTSNRVYDSIKRLPMRYPATMRYYHYLFTGELGFELAADITSYPTLFGIPIPDQSADESFTVYDHPRVLIFRKTAAFSPERAERLITGGVNWNEVYKMPVATADRVPTALRLTESQWQHDHEAGTWSEMFDPHSLANRLAPVVWLLAVEALGLAIFPLLFRLLPWLPDRGWSLARVLGVLLVASSSWLLASLGVLPFLPMVMRVWLAVAVVLVCGVVVGWSARADILAFGRSRARALLTAEGVFLVAFALGVLVRWYNPDLWHPSRGGEKPMEFVYLNAVLQSASFPPYDPWFAGGYINYYYFGFVIVGSLMHLTAIVPSVAFNLAVPTIFALTAVGAWGVVYNLLAPSRRSPARPGAARLERRALLSALLAPVFVLLLGNLAQPIWFLNGRAAENAYRPEWAYWDATRIVEGTVNEFPFFTFLFADMHPHMLVMPFSLALLGLTVALARMPVQLKRKLSPASLSRSLSRFSSLSRSLSPSPSLSFANPSFLLLLLLMGWLAGTLSATNTWDYPTFVGLTIATLGVVHLHHHRYGRQAQADGPGRAFPAFREPGASRLVRSLLSFVLSVAVVVLVGRLCFAPFFASFATESSGIRLLLNESYPSLFEQIWQAPRTSVRELLLMHGLWLFLTLSAGLAVTNCWLRRRLPKVKVRKLEENGDGDGDRVRRVLALLLTSVLAGIFAALLLVGIIRDYADPLLLAPMVVGGGVLLLLLLQRSPRRTLPLWWGTTALALCLGVELVVVRGDVGRMNTVFKFGLHAWILFALAAAVVLPWLWGGKHRGAEGARTSLLNRAGRWAWRGAVVVLLLASLVYPLTATPARVSDRFREGLPHTLDGTAFMNFVSHQERDHTFPLDEDAEAIAWMHEHIQGTPIILEAHLPSYRWAGRIATFTGLPTLLGWEWHQIQQRMVSGAEPVIHHRQQVIAQIYNDPDPFQAFQLIQTYGIEYVYTGGVEQALYEPAGLDKFETLVQRGLFQRVFQYGTTTLYRVTRPGPPTVVLTDIPVDTSLLPLPDDEM
ncbi:MAG: hypothetical protein HC884_01670 [Chloroflexaceae bacterium]|nr:hypothetical protein [Chloroflexaceae bacterium]